MKKSLTVIGILLLLTGVFVLVSFLYFQNIQESNTIPDSISNSSTSSASTVSNESETKFMILSDQKQRVISAYNRCSDSDLFSKPSDSTSINNLILPPQEETFVDPEGRYSVKIPRDFVIYEYSSGAFGKLWSMEDYKNALLNLEKTCFWNQDSIGYYTFSFRNSNGFRDYDSWRNNLKVVYTVKFENEEIDVYFPNNYGDTTYAYIPFLMDFLRLVIQLDTRALGKEIYETLFANITKLSE